jgi:hypothetical protein
LFQFDEAHITRRHFAVLLSTMKYFLVLLALLLLCASFTHCVEEDADESQGTDNHQIIEGVFGGEIEKNEEASIASTTDDSDDINLTTSIEALDKSWSNITVTVSGWDKKCLNSFIGVHVPELGSEEVIDKAFVNPATNSAVFRLIDLGYDYQFQFYEPSEADCASAPPTVLTNDDSDVVGGDNSSADGKIVLTAAGSKQAPKPQKTYKAKGKRKNVKNSGDVPTGIRLQVSTKNDEIQVVWNTKSKQKPVVHYGRTPKKLDQSAAAFNSFTYKASDMCGAPATHAGPKGYIPVGFYHTAKMTGLKPDTYYWYRVSTNGVSSKLFRFRSQPVVGSNVMQGFLALADSGNSRKTFPKMNRAVKDSRKAGTPINFLLHVGDLSYAWSRGIVWKGFEAISEYISRRVPYMVALGNHEYSYTKGGANDPTKGNYGGHSWGPATGHDSHGECGVPASARFRGSGNGNTIAWYSFNQGSAHIIMFSSEHDYTKGSKQYNFIAKDLANVDRSKTPWIVMASHRPMYLSPGTSKLGRMMRSALEPLMLKYKVSLYLSGHYHSYQRSCAMAKDRCVTGKKTGVVHTMIGNGGIGKLPHIPARSRWSKWLRSNMAARGYIKVSYNSKKMNVALYSAEVYGKVLDKFSIKAIAAGKSTGPKSGGKKGTKNPTKNGGRPIVPPKKKTTPKKN